MDTLYSTALNTTGICVSVDIDALNPIYVYSIYFYTSGFTLIEILPAMQKWENIDKTERHITKKQNRNDLK